MYQEILINIKEILNIINAKNIDKNKHQKLINLLNELIDSIQNNKESKIIPLLNKIISYISYNKELVNHKELVEINRNILKTIKKSFSLNEEQELIEIASEYYIKGEITAEEYFLYLIPKENKKYNGELKNEELQALINANFSQKEINKIKGYLEKYKDSLSGYKDLVGDTLVPNKKLFFFLMDHYGYLMSNNPNEVITEKDVKLRRKINPLIKAIGKKALKNGQIIENRELLIKNFDNENQEPFIPTKDKGIILPEEPVIWVVNHGFKDDTLATILACLRHAYILFGNCAQFYNTMDGALAHLNGIFQCNRKSQASKKASVDKALKTIGYGADLVIFPEAIWNKSPNKLTLEFWSGFYKIAKESGAKIVPMIHYITDATKISNPIHTVIDNPIDISSLTEQEAKEYLTEIFSTWQIMMMKAYGKSTHKKELEGFSSPHEAWENHLTQLVSQVNRFDSEAEHFADYRSLDTEILRPENVWDIVAKLTKEAEKEQNEICRLVKRLKEEDYQRRI